MIKIREIFSFLPVINHSVTLGLRFVLLSILEITSSDAIKIIRLFFGLYSSIFL